MTATAQFSASEVTIWRYSDSSECDVVVLHRGREMVLRCRDYRQALDWARIECKTYNVPDARALQAPTPGAVVDAPGPAPLQ